MFRAAVFLGLLAAPAPALAQQAPEPRPDPSVIRAEDQSEFDTWASAYRGRALVQGVPRDVLDAVLEQLTVLPQVVAADRDRRLAQSPVWTYLDAAITEPRFSAGRSAMGREARILDAIEQRYGIPPAILTAIWGIESDYGQAAPMTAGLSVLASLAQGARRPAAYEAQLTAALKIIAAGDIAGDDLTSAPDGTMGQTGILPTTLIAQGVDFDGDGRRDIWDDPADALATSAAILAGYGWVAGQPWGTEVLLPDGFTFSGTVMSQVRSPAEWAQLGVTSTDGTPVADYGPASLLLPAGGRGAAFLVFPNFDVLRRYDPTDAWPLAVGLLADRLEGGAPLTTDWPRDDRALTTPEIEAMQRLLTLSGFDTFGADGRIGPMTMAAIRAFQADRGMVPDGYASLRVLRALRD